MPQTHLTPKDAAHLAQVVYGGLKQEDPRQILARYGNEIGSSFSPASGTIDGKTGAIFKRVSNFAMVLNGKGRYAGHRVVTIRGTDFPSLSDWLTNGNVAVAKGPGGNLVHAGFNRVYKSIIGPVTSALGDASGGPVHVCGHSLGGAIANNLAMDLKLAGHDVALYTFGAPRSGYLGHATDLTTKIGKNNIKRVYNISDPVPMVPIFPFMHPPFPGDGIRVGTPTDMIWTSHHSMLKYISIMGSHTWTNVADAGQKIDTRWETVEDALFEAGKYTNVPGGSWALWALGKALGLIMESVGGLGMLAITGAVTAVDLVASMLIKAVQIAGQIGEWVLSWIKTALEWLGREVMVSAADITRSFLRYVLNLMYARIAGIARQALDRLPGV